MVLPTRLSPVSRSQSTTTTVEDLHTTRAVLLIPAHPRTTLQPPTRNNTLATYNRCQSPGAPTIRTRGLSTRAAGLTLNRPISRLSLGSHNPSQWSPARTSYNNPANTLPLPHVINVTTSIDLEVGTIGAVTDHTVTQNTSTITDRIFIPVLNDGASGYWCFLLMFWKPVFIVAALNLTPCPAGPPTHRSVVRCPSEKCFSTDCSLKALMTYTLYFYSYMHLHF